MLSKATETSLTCFLDFNRNLKITLKEKLDNHFIHRFQDVDELNEITTKIKDQHIHIQAESEDI